MSDLTKQQQFNLGFMIGKLDEVNVILELLNRHATPCDPWVDVDLSWSAKFSTYSISIRFEPFALGVLDWVEGERLIFDEPSQALDWVRSNVCQ